MTIQIHTNSSWILIYLLKHMDKFSNLQNWRNIPGRGNVCTKAAYQELRPLQTKVDWRKMFYQNLATPRAQLHFWMAYHGRLATKDLESKTMDVVRSLQTGRNNATFVFWVCSNKEYMEQSIGVATDKKKSHGLGYRASKDQAEMERERLKSNIAKDDSYRDSIWHLETQKCLV